MLDVRDLRENMDKVKKALSKRNDDFNLDRFNEIDIKRREAIQEIEKLKNQQNISSKEIPLLKKEGKDTTKVLEDLKNLSDEIKELEPKVRDLDESIREFLLNIPNTPHDKVPEGKSDEDNIEIRRWGEPTKLDFEPIPHWDLGESLDIIDPVTAAKVTGARFVFYKGLGARLERSLSNLMLNIHQDEHGYKEVLPPFMVNSKSMIGTGQLPKFADDAFKLEGLDYYLVPTAEVPITNMYMDDILEGDKLPIKYCAYSSCFRFEAGSAGRDTRGLIRQHQFQKVELVKFTKPEDSYEELEKLTKDAEHILQLLGLPYRVVLLSGGDLGFSSAMTYDIEVWMPSYNRYVEISSCSNFEGYQARRANIRYKNNPKDKAEHVHTINGSGLAVGRTTAAVMENYQQKDGSIKIPEVLIPLMQGIDRITKEG